MAEGNVAPALQAARDQLQRSQLEVRVIDPQRKVSITERSDGFRKDKLDQKLLHRPKPEELVRSGILKGKIHPAAAVSTTDHLYFTADEAPVSPT